MREKDSDTKYQCAFRAGFAQQIACKASALSRALGAGVRLQVRHADTCGVFYQGKSQMVCYIYGWVLGTGIMAPNVV